MGGATRSHCCVLALFLSVPSLSAQDATWQLGASLSFLTGDYGEESDTDLLQIPFVLKRYFSRGDLTLTVPYVDISTDGDTAVTAGEVVAITGAETDSGAGLGDIILKGRYYAIDQRGYLPFIDVAAKIKLPTADKEKNLGTEETDVSLITEFSRSISDDFFTLAEIGYTWMGDPPEGDLKNRWIYSIGAGYVYMPRWTLSGYIDGRTALVDGNDDPLSLLFSTEFKYRPKLRFDTMLEIGLNDGSPDYGITLGVRYRL